MGNLDFRAPEIGRPSAMLIAEEGAPRPLGIGDRIKVGRSVFVVASD